jgi:hypothetical protein
MWKDDGHASRFVSGGIPRIEQGAGRSAKNIDLHGSEFGLHHLKAAA